jgi:hypothetical protein
MLGSCGVGGESFNTGLFLVESIHQGLAHWATVGIYSWMHSYLKDGADVWALWNLFIGNGKVRFHLEETYD